MSTDTHNRIEGLDRPAVERIARVFSVLADPTRLEILRLLHAGEMNVGQLVEKLDVKQPCVSKQLGILYDAGVVSRRRSSTQVYYWIADPMIFQLCDLVCGKLHQDARRQARVFGARR